ncbi:MAG: HD domain-containing protein [Clostridia bacterium]|nr:HD domain-containing protein [Clostridia bacterium]
MTVHQVDALREQVKKRLPEKRMAHVLRVEEQILWLGKMLLPTELLRLQVAALLHDIAKDTPDEEQIALCETLGIPLTEKEKALPPILHAKSGAYIAERDFPEYVDSGILYAILHHTEGDVPMPAFARILMLADFTEKGRTWERCKACRRFLESIVYAKTKAEKWHYFSLAFAYMLHLKYDYIASVTEGLDEKTKKMLAYYGADAHFE